MGLTIVRPEWGAGCLPIIIPDQDQPSPETLSRVYAIADNLTDVAALIP